MQCEMQVLRLPLRTVQPDSQLVFGAEALFGVLTCPRYPLPMRTDDRRKRRTKGATSEKRTRAVQNGSGLFFG
eukprot:7829799-Pyramimonas_sp.AAC.1